MIRSLIMPVSERGHRMNSKTNVQIILISNHILLINQEQEPGQTLNTCSWFHLIHLLNNDFFIFFIFLRRKGIVKCLQRKITGYKNRFGIFHLYLETSFLTAFNQRNKKMRKFYFIKDD